MGGPGSAAERKKGAAAVVEVRAAGGECVWIRVEQCEEVRAAARKMGSKGGEIKELKARGGRGGVVVWLHGIGTGGTRHVGV